MRAFGPAPTRGTSVGQDGRPRTADDHPNEFKDGAGQRPLSTAEGRMFSAKEVEQIRAHIETLEQRLAILYGQVRQARQIASLDTAAPTMAHEVNNLLTPMIGYVDQAIRTDDEALRKKALGVAWRNAQVLVAMADRILRISAADTFVIENAALRSIVDDAESSLCRDLAKDSITFVNEVDPALEIRADKLSVQQVFFNLFLNARDAMAKQHGGRLKVTAEKCGETVTIRVADTGPGIDADRLDRIFEALQSSKVESSDGRCRGLGLALCRNLISEMRGSIRAESELGKGAAFIIEIPAAEQDSAEHQATQTSDAKQPTSPNAPTPMPEPTQQAQSPADDEASESTLKSDSATNHAHNGLAGSPNAAEKHSIETTAASLTNGSMATT